jgi:hypothetical protein
MLKDCLEEQLCQEGERHDETAEKTNDCMNKINYCSERTTSNCISCSKNIQTYVQSWTKHLRHF